MIGEEEIDEVVKTLRSGWITTGPQVERLSLPPSGGGPGRGA